MKSWKKLDGKHRCYVHVQQGPLRLVKLLNGPLKFLTPGRGCVISVCLTPWACTLVVPVFHGRTFHSPSPEPGLCSMCTYCTSIPGPRHRGYNTGDAKRGLGLNDNESMGLSGPSHQGTYPGPGHKLERADLMLL